MRTLARRIAGIALLLLIVFLAWRAWGHDHYTPYKTPAGGSCCNDKDCRPVDASEIGESGDQYTWQGARFPKRQSQPSFDERYHVCATRHWMLGGQGGWTIICLLRPSPGA